MGRLLCPSGVSLDTARKIQDAMTKTMQKNDIKEKLIAQGLDLSPIPNNKLTDYLKQKLNRWAKIVKTSGATVD
jgi:tripartite-type tricarboxylate transporter receptor subunit TctC